MRFVSYLTALLLLLGITITTFAHQDNDERLVSISARSLRGHALGSLDTPLSPSTPSSVLCHIMELRVEFMDLETANATTSNSNQQELVCETTLPGEDKSADSGNNTRAALWIYRMINLPQSTIDDLSMEFSAWIHISHVIRDDNQATLEVLSYAVVSIVAAPDDIISLADATTTSTADISQQAKHQQYRHRHLTPTYQSMGYSKVLVVRVSYLDHVPDVTLDDLRGRIFGMGPGAHRDVNLRRQIKACSFGKLILQPAHSPAPKFRSNDSAPILQGVTEMRITTAMANPNSPDSVRVLENMVSQKLKDWFGSSYLANDVNHIMIVLPDAPGVIKFRGRNYLAYAFLRGKWSVFNNYWGVSLSALAHELGHNWNLNHAGAFGGVAYGDTTGYLGWGVQRGDYPQSCFNAQKNWFLGWYQDRSQALVAASSSSSSSSSSSPPPPVDTGDNHTMLLPWTGDLATFVDYDSTSADQPVVLQIQSDNQELRLYCQYNRAKNFNRDTREYQDQVVIIQEKGPLQARLGIQSWLVGAILPPPYRVTAKPNEYHFNVTNFASEDRALHIQVCQRLRGAVDYVRISIYLDGQTSGCFVDDEPQGGAPLSSSPSCSPSLSLVPTIAPSSTPTISPMPSKSPSSSPSTSTGPSVHPSTTPSSAPSTSTRPSVHPSTTPSDYCEDTTEKFKLTPTSTSYINCAWLTRNADIVARQNLCQPENTVNSVAPVMCPDTCGLCFDDCDDSEQDFYVNEAWGRQDCLWLSSRRPALVRELCAPEAASAAYELCRDTCDRCSAVNNKRPPCEDSAGLFWIRRGFPNERQRGCIWLARRTFGEQEGFCQQLDISDRESAHHVCPETCGKCVDTCEDDPNFDFRVNRVQGSKDCQWLSTRPGWQGKLCQGKVLEQCRESCNNCEAY